METIPFTPDNILQGQDGRWYYAGVDISDYLLWWRCPVGHSWQATLTIRTSDNDPGCPECAAATTFSPDHILRGQGGRWYYEGVDISDRLIWWRCVDGHEWQATLAVRTSPDDPGCPTCLVNSSL